jgi:hypothetical protein
MYGTSRNHEQNLCVRSNAPVPEKLTRDYHCDALNRSLTQFSRRTRRAINKMLAPLSEAEDMAACEAICFSITTDRPLPHLKSRTHQPNSAMDRFVYRFTKNFTLLRKAEITTMLTPAYLTLSSPETSLSIALLQAMRVDVSNVHTSSGHWMTRTFPKKRKAILHGSMMGAAAPSLTIENKDLEWFGSNRERIAPIWDIIVNDGSFDPDRIEALINNSGHGPLALLEGAL